MIKQITFTLVSLTLIACGSADPGPDPVDQRPPGDTCPACKPEPLHVNKCLVTHGQEKVDVWCDPLQDPSVFLYGTAPDGTQTDCKVGVCTPGTYCIITNGGTLDGDTGVCL